MLRRLRHLWHGPLALLLLAALCSMAKAQAPPPPPPAEDTTGVTNGVLVDAEGVLRRQVFADPNGRLQRERVLAARAKLAPELAKASKLRKVSLNRLEAAIRARAGRSMPATEEMRYLAGMTRLQYV